MEVGVQKLEPQLRVALEFHRMLNTFGGLPQRYLTLWNVLEFIYTFPMTQSGFRSFSQGLPFARINIQPLYKYKVYTSLNNYLILPIYLCDFSHLSHSQPFEIAA